MNAPASYETSDSIAYFRIDRPERSNALNGEALELLDQALDDAAADPDIHALVFEGRGKGFSSGYDLAPTGAINIKHQTMLQDWARLQRNNDRWERIFSFPKPTVAKVHGFALAGGLELALSCDFVISTDDARFGHPPLRALGVPPFMLFPQTMGHRDSREMLLTGNSVSGREARGRGWITRAVPAEDLDAAVEEVLASLRAMPLDNLLLIKRSLLRADMIVGHRAVRGIGVEFDAIAHRTDAAGAFWDRVDEAGLTRALRDRDEPFVEWSTGD
ncbi:enoyl-CoA hydratase-related protein [Aeromicrobium sp. CF4.19]|uniref:enoyl-CoA hydratase-related protein n=1 Tax=Aeromicrobium sp. CF4.19 TaxID=3373082 RepID=UPI003EE70A7C